jgi:ABC-type Fe3+ transport system substrate-binding protein
LLQGAIVIKHGPNAEEAHQFLDFLLSAPIRKELGERGLKAP